MTDLKISLFNVARRVLKELLKSDQKNYQKLMQGEVVFIRGVSPTIAVSADFAVNGEIVGRAAYAQLSTATFSDIDLSTIDFGKELVKIVYLPAKQDTALAADQQIIFGSDLTVRIDNINPDLTVSGVVLRSHLVSSLVRFTA